MFEKLAVIPFFSKVSRNIFYLLIRFNEMHRTQCATEPSFLQLNGDGNKWDIRTAFFETKVSVVQTFFVTKFCYVKLLMKHKIFQSKLSSHEFYEVCHKNEIQSRNMEILGDFAETEVFLISLLQRVRIHHLLRSS